MIRLIHEGDEIPFGYGFMWYDFYRDADVFAPLPLNFIARWAVDLYVVVAIRRSRPHWEQLLRDTRRWAFGDGLAVGQRRGYKDGYEAGYKDGEDALRKQLQDDFAKALLGPPPR